MFADTLNQYPRMRQTQARLVASTQLKNGMGLVRWDNQGDYIENIRADHHTLSVYLDGAAHSVRRQGARIIGSQAHSSMCLLPASLATTWDVSGPISLLHFYFSDAHLQQLIEQVWDKDGQRIQLDEIDFAQDPLLIQLFCTTLSQSNWQDPLDQLALDSATQTALIHTLRHYSQRRLPTPRPSGGLPGWQLKRVVDFAEHHLDQPLTLSELAGVTGLSDYHFARMFRQATGYAPHRYVLHRRLVRARQLLEQTALSMTEIALQCGFGSSSHFSNRFRRETGTSPSQYRALKR
ncbi:helix-turn-helix domain-containing protein [Natronospirillum operosum]|uniref:Helix-turn-helix domain-containing protein n=1 Tax=Natronospirillum operosum TaxID=2759953 RepID=A0A4Z0WFL4_9GAMM|nr:helix-turn-helix domain-containing protein [Natronospirillum operosum]TGG93941.1 helix-turn-helix domain-containing protein [Natronospirillum operosum]